MQQSHHAVAMPRIAGAQICILQSKWYREHTDLLTAKCKELLESAGATVTVSIVPGCLEIALAAKIMLQKKPYDAVCCLGVLMKGETDHYEMILQSCVVALQSVSLEYNVPLVNGILPVSNLQQVIARASDNDFNKGIEVALAAAEFISWRAQQAA
jgi:6,7-dimethyl-8-ribityllumazine synthase